MLNQASSAAEFLEKGIFISYFTGVVCLYTECEDKKFVYHIIIARRLHMELSSCCPNHGQVTLMNGSFNESETHEIQASF